MKGYQKCAKWLLAVLFFTSAMLAGGAQSSNDKLGGDFSLTDHHGKPFHLQSQRGKIVLLYFGYTTCTEACPTMLATVARAYRVLGERAAQVQFLLLSVDPKRDPAEKLKTYLDYFRVNAIGLTGTKEAIDKVVKQYGARYEIEPSDSALGYHISHTTDLYLIDQQGKLRHRFNHHDSSATIAAGVKERLGN
jgi:protein SCO1/2